MPLLVATAAMTSDIRQFTSIARIVASPVVVMILFIVVYQHRRLTVVVVAVGIVIIVTLVVVVVVVLMLHKLKLSIHLIVTWQAVVAIQ